MNIQNTIGLIDHALYNDFVILPIMGGLLGAFFFAFIVVIALKTGILREFLGDFIVAWNRGVLREGRFRSHWKKVEKNMAEPDESSWHQALIAADVILGNTIAEMGYKGATFDERFQRIDPRHFPFFDEAVSAHKVVIYFEQDQNYRISREAAEKTFDIYKRIFEALGII